MNGLALSDRFRVTRVAEIPPGAERPSLFQGMIPRRAMTGVVSHPKGFKSQLVLQMSVAVASGTAPFGSPLMPAVAADDTGNVLYLLGEGNERALRDRIHTVCAVEGVNFDAVALDIEHSFNPAQLDRDEDVGALRDLLGQLRPTLVVIDPLREFHSGPENDAGHISLVMRRLRALCLEFKTTLILIHHTTKNVEMRTDVMRGSSALWGALDGRLHLRRLEPAGLVVEGRYRDAADAGPFRFELETIGKCPYLRLVALAGDGETAGEDALRAALLTRLEAVGGGPLTVEQLRKGRNAATVTAILKGLAAEGTITKVSGRGYRLAPVPVLHTEDGNGNGDSTFVAGLDDEG